MRTNVFYKGKIIYEEECPYCGGDVEIDHDDAYGFDEDETYEQCCKQCNKTFVYNTSIMYHYDLYKADCLNGGDHDYKPTCTAPVKCTKMVCSMCDDTRSCTNDEMLQVITQYGKNHP